MKKIYLFRHGETDWNVKNVIQCTKDTELNENGIKQAEKNAEKPPCRPCDGLHPHAV